MTFSADGSSLGRVARHTVSVAPLTLGYLAVLSATTLLLSRVSSTRSTQVLLAFSTNLHELARVPLRVLIGSAFWTTGWGELEMWLVLFVAVLAPVERRVGWRRTLVVLAAGHLGATVVVAGGLWIALHVGAVAPTVADAEDVGASYAFFAVAAFAGYLVGPRGRPLFFGALGAYLLSGAVQSHTFTTFGHLAAAAIGLACRPLAGGSVRSGYGWLGVGRVRARGGRARDLGLQPEQGLLRGAWRDEARSGALLPVDRGAADARRPRTAGPDAAVPARRRRSLVLPEARS